MSMKTESPRSTGLLVHGGELADTFGTHRKIETLSYDEFDAKFPRDALINVPRNASRRWGKKAIEAGKDIRARQEMTQQTADLEHVMVERRFKSFVPYISHFAYTIPGIEMRRKEQNMIKARKVAVVSLAGAALAGIAYVGINATNGGSNENAAPAQEQSPGTVVYASGRIACSDKVLEVTMTPADASNPFTAMERTGGTADIPDDFSYATLPPEISTALWTDVQASNSMPAGTELVSGTKFLMPIDCTLQP